MPSAVQNCGQKFGQGDKWKVWLMAMRMRRISRLPRGVAPGAAER
jgi:hypothetical protein